MGVKSTMASLSYAVAHVAAAQKGGQNVQSLHTEIQLQITELVKNLTILVATAQVGDPNITTINNQIAALS